jgi:hypothetical protein
MSTGTRKGFKFVTKNSKNANFETINFDEIEKESLNVSNNAKLKNARNDDESIQKFLYNIFQLFTLYFYLT